MLKYIYTFITFFLLLGNAHAQVPGYQGKRFFVEYNLLNNSGAALAFRSENLRFFHQLKANYIISRKHILSGNVQFNPIKIKELQDDVLTEHKIPATTFGLSLFFFKSRKSRLPPIGFNWGLTIEYTIVNTQEVLERSKTNFIDMGFNYNYRRVLFDKMTVNIGFQANIMSLFLSDAQLGSHNPINNLSVTKQDIHARAAADKIFALYIGVGYLLF